MQYINDLKYHQKMLFDGDETQFYTFKFTLNVEGLDVDIKTSDFYSNPLAKLKNEISDQEFQSILLQGNFEKNEELVEKYLGTESFQVYYCFKHLTDANTKFLFMFSFEEIQPTRFRLYLEGIWRG